MLQRCQYRCHTSSVQRPVPIILKRVPENALPAVAFVCAGLWTTHSGSEDASCVLGWFVDKPPQYQGLLSLPPSSVPLGDAQCDKIRRSQDASCLLAVLPGPLAVPFSGWFSPQLICVRMRRAQAAVDTRSTRRASFETTVRLYAEYEGVHGPSYPFIGPCWDSPQAGSRVGVSRHVEVEG